MGEEPYRQQGCQTLIYNILTCMPHLLHRAYGRGATLSPGLPDPATQIQSTCAFLCSFLQGFSRHQQRLLSHSCQTRVFTRWSGPVVHISVWFSRNNWRKSWLSHAFRVFPRWLAQGWAIVGFLGISWVDQRQLSYSWPAFFTRRLFSADNEIQNCD